MIVEIKKGNPKGQVLAPPSKSMAHRYLICAALAKGISVIHNVSLSKDIEATIGGLRELGAEITVKGNDVTVKGIECFASSPEIYCNESGSTLRFLLPLCLIESRSATLKGSLRLFERPLEIYEEICRKEGIEFAKSADSVSLCGKLCGGEYSIAGNVSSQFISGLLFALSKLQRSSRLKVTTSIESMPYIDMTLAAMRDFGVNLSLQNGEFIIPEHCEFKPQEITVEGDYSNAAFLDAFNFLGGEVEVSGLKSDSLQGDKVYKEYYKKLMEGTPTLDVSQCPDLGPVLMGVAAANNGAEFIGTHRLRIKESDRGSAMAEELEKFGVKVKTEENSIKVSSGVVAPSEVLSGHNDHRIVMTLALLCTLTGGTISDAEAVAKSYPDFFSALGSLGIEANVIET